MEQIDLARIELFFANSGSKIYSIAAQTVDQLGMADMIAGGVLVGLSGGADSIMLLLFLIEYRRRQGIDFKILASHVNHGIRGEEADADQALCRMLCDSLSIELVEKKYPVPEVAKSYRMGIEEAARMVRYSHFQNIISGRDDISCIAVAHNMSDNAETVLFNIMRGSGARGAAGIPAVRDNILRPLIRVSKKNILSALDDFSIPYAVDSSNLSDDYSRNYIRHNVIPGLERITRDPERMLSRFADNMRCDEDYIRCSAEDFINSHSPILNSDLLALHPAVYVRVLNILSAAVGGSVSYSIAENVRSLLEKDNFSYSLIGNAVFVCERGCCRVTRIIGNKTDYCFEVDYGVNDLSPLNAKLVLFDEKIDKTYLNVYKISIQADLSSAIISGSLYLRPKKDGDTVYYGGMTHKLKKLFSDRKIPPSKRGLIPILCDDKGVVWVPGFGVRDDGPSDEVRSGLKALLEIDPDGGDRLYCGSEFRS